MIEQMSGVFSDEVSAGVVLVDFWAPWCGPCKALIPTLGKLSAELAGKVRILGVNIETAPVLVARMGLKGVPCMVLYVEGVEVDRLTGNQPFEVIRSSILKWIEG